MKYNIPLILYVVLQLVAFILLLAGTPSDIFIRTDHGPGYPTICLTLWGFKTDCSSRHHTLTIDRTFGACPPRVHRFRAAQAFTIISILVYGAAFIAGLTLLFCCSFLRLVCLALNIVGSVTLCVVWAAMAVTYNKADGPQCTRLSEVYKYGSGFVLFLIAWLLDIINIIILLLPYTGDLVHEDEKPESQTAPEEMEMAQENAGRA
ncbi:amastin-like surface protein [Leishmania donovani]|uniref:Amastin surface glycofamily protein n=1 Tax=Leishmania donovani TaxID=5661 RepID=A0A6J8FKV2_LEIDO|nr:amastin-like surface protein [Leishmania donovani]VDZ48347.1 amastin-like_surface_protein_putative/GeneDB:LmjF.34.1560/GeneDB:LmjF.34.1580/GeneDB:LmjF.34.1600/GeneDB:LmjF.34.1620/GeneDB:LmjF.34.1640/GeneDB:LmjF.34.1660/GeneDB:LmjF.34.1680/GeneDB:LmjF.34.1700/GeneDB:LmjF.34.1720/GeneDB:LmjF.34.1740/GeneDB:LmjF.34.1760/GeneDB:LmjF.34.1780/GeneDB:LmjF.34.1800/GeneDB:LmjF.34.1820/GeneDB:LmjF.34.1860/GeneDB:LmjF.34.1880/GeneDB:LmjF.34.1900/GeneDB:LmjF.34.1920/GeneDB:LmjF.34.1940/GeneDB:LmjF.34.1960/